MFISDKLIFVISQSQTLFEPVALACDNVKACGSLQEGFKGDSTLLLFAGEFLVRNYMLYNVVCLLKKCLKGFSSETVRE